MTRLVTWSPLPKHDVLGDSLELLDLSKGSCLKEDFHGLLETGLSKWPVNHSVNAVPRNTAKLPSLSHDVTQGAQMPVVHVNPIGVKDDSDLLDQPLPGGLDSQDVKDLFIGIGDGPTMVHQLVG